MSAVLLYTTWPDADAARQCARALIEDRLAACANIMPAGRSIYRWEGTVREDPEIVMLVKTNEAKALDARERILALNSYSTPCVMGLDVLAKHSHRALS